MASNSLHRCVLAVGLVVLVYGDLYVINTLDGESVLPCLAVS